MRQAAALGWMLAGLVGSSLAWAQPVMPPYEGPAPLIKAGVASSDGTGFVGASAGQYADIATSGPGSVFPDKRDPQAYSTAKQGSYGIQSRLTTRALVVEGANGKRVVLLKTDYYLAQDLFLRRIGQILATGDSGIAREQILYHVTHNHSSPYQLTQSAGVWIFQDEYSEIAFEHAARAAADAIERAVANLKPARMGATTVKHDIVKANVVGAAIATDGTPAGYPRGFNDDGLSVIRFDDLSDPANPQPLAIWMNHGEHPESLDGYHLVSGDFVVQMERFVDRETGALLVFSQGDVGSAEGPYAGRGDTPNPVLADGQIRAWAHAGNPQMERAGRLLANSVLEAYNLIGQNDPSVQVPYTTDFPVDWFDYWVPGPVSHPEPTVSNCAADQTYAGDPGAPVAGLPDCERAGGNGFPGLPDYLTVVTGGPAGQAAPSHMGAPGHPAVEENKRIHLQTMRLGEVLLGSCACEAQVDLILNFESRADNVEGNIFDGFDWACLLPEYEDEAVCVQQREYFDPAQLPDIRGPNLDPDAIAHMRAQVHNDATGWDLPENSAAAQGQEPADNEQIWGNFSKQELPAHLGYAMVVGVGHAGDYNGYTVSYREYMSRDSYRKALTAYGPHTADYMVTRMVRMAGFMKGGPAVQPEPNAASAEQDEQRQEGQAVSAGQSAAQQYEQRLSSLPDDPGLVEIDQQPESIQRYRAATVRWRGGSNAVDSPIVVVERMVDGAWTFFADQSGEIQLMAEFPTSDEETAAREGSFEWFWTASFEGFMPFPAGLGNGTPDGEYRFVIDGQTLVGGVPTPYHLESLEFEISPWAGIPVVDLRLGVDGVLSFATEAYSYPITYDSPFLLLSDDGKQPICETCSFRPWAHSGTPTIANVSVVRDGGETLVPATLNADTARWEADTGVAPGEPARVALKRGAVVDDNGEINALEVFIDSPPAFGFPLRPRMPPNTFVTSTRHTLVGFQTSLPISVSGGAQYRVNGGAFTNDAGTVSVGDAIDLRHITAPGTGTLTTSFVTVGNFTASFQTQNLVEDTVPEPLDFGRQDNVEPGALIESEVVTPTGFDGNTKVRPLLGAEYRIDDGAWQTSNGRIDPGQTIQLRHVASSKSQTFRETAVRIGGVRGKFVTRTRHVD